MRVLVDDISWDAEEGQDITALPVVAMIELNFDEIEDQDDFWEQALEAVSNKYGFACAGFHYQILEGTVH